MTRFAGLLIVPVFVVLCILWCTAGTAHASTWEETGCVTRPMVQGRAGENVTTCELRHVATTVAAAPVKRTPVRLAKRHAKRRPALVARLDHGGKNACDVSVWEENGQEHMRTACTMVVHYRTL